MICERCHGTGKRLNPALVADTTPLGGVRINNPHGWPLLVTCEDCGGNGVTHCCEGLRAQPGEDG